jgi:hypothetical protein
VQFCTDAAESLAHPLSKFAKRRKDRPAEGRIATPRKRTKALMTDNRNGASESVNVTDEIPPLEASLIIVSAPSRALG